MARITTEALLDRLSSGNFKELKLKGMQDGSFCMLLETTDEAFIDENPDGSMKQYPKVDHALTWLKRMTRAKSLSRY